MNEVIKDQSKVELIAEAGFGCLGVHSPFKWPDNIIYQRRLSIDEKSCTWIAYMLDQNPYTISDAGDGQYSILPGSVSFFSLHCDDKGFCQITTRNMKFNHLAAIELYKDLTNKN